MNKRLIASLKDLTHLQSRTCDYHDQWQLKWHNELTALLLELQKSKTDYLTAQETAPSLTVVSRLQKSSSEKEQSLQGNAITAYPSEENLYCGEGNSYRTPDV